MLDAHDCDNYVMWFYTPMMIDRYRETPFAVRFLLTTLQLAALGGAVYLFLFRLGVPTLDALAGRAEEHCWFVLLGCGWSRVGGGFFICKVRRGSPACRQGRPEFVALRFRGGPCFLDPGILRRRDVHLDEDRATAEEASGNSRDRDGTADIPPAAREHSKDCGRTERQEQN